MRPTRPSNGTPAAVNSVRMFATSLAMPGTEHQAALADLVEGGELVRQHHRVAQGRQKHRGAELHFPRPRRHRREQSQGVVPRPGQQRVADPYRVETEPLGPCG